MNLRFRASGVAVLLLLAIATNLACAGDDAPAGPQAMETATVPPQPTPKPPVAPTFAPAPTPFMPSGQTIVVLDEELRVTGDPVLDPILRELEAEDVEAVVQRSMAGPGIAVGGCDYPPHEGGGGFEPGDAAMRGWIADALSGGVTVFAARSVGVGKGPGHEYQVWLSAGARPSPTAPSSFWTFTQAGFLKQLAFDCDVRGAAQGVAGAYGDPTAYEVRSRASCVPGEAGARLEVIDIVQFDPTNMEIMAFAIDAAGGVTADRVFVEVQHDDGRLSAYIAPMPDRTPAPVWTEFGAEFRTIYDVRDGKRIEVHGWRYWNCVIEAWTIRPAA